MKVASINPFSEEMIAEYGLMTPERVETRLEESDKAFKTWRRFTLAERLEHFALLAKSIENRKQELSVLATKEMGKTLGESIAELDKCIATIRYYLENGHKFLNDEMIREGEFQARVVFEPLGIIVGIMPWNFPYWQAFRFAIPTVLAGNCVVLKHAANTLGCGEEMESLFLDAGFPMGVFSHFIVSHPQIETLLGDSRVRGVSLTGSTKAGRVIGELAGRYLKKSVLELGGSDAYVVFGDADLELAVEKCVQSRLINNGQSCVAAKRFIVHESLYADFVEMMKSSFAKKVLGDPLHASTDIGPIARKDLKEELEGQIRQAVSEGAKVIEYSGSAPQKGFFVPPQILTGVKAPHSAFKKEFFGPVAMVFSFSSESEAIALANGTPYGLGGAVFSKDTERAITFARQELQAGLVGINDMVKSDPRIPFGGVKASGYGRELARFGLREFANVKSLING